MIRNNKKLIFGGEGIYDEKVNKNLNINCRFVITSDKGHRSQLFELRIIVCPDCVNGTCKAENEFEKIFTGMRYLNCTCNDGWAGKEISIVYVQASTRTHMHA